MKHDKITDDIQEMAEREAEAALDELIQSKEGRSRGRDMEALVRGTVAEAHRALDEGKAEK